MPVSSMVRQHAEGLRYLRVTCAAEWHVDARKCSKAANRAATYLLVADATSCGESQLRRCGTYLKCSIGEKAKVKQWPTASRPRWCWTRAGTGGASPAVPSTFLFPGKGNIQFLRDTGWQSTLAGSFINSAVAYNVYSGRWQWREDNALAGPVGERLPCSQLPAYPR